MSYHKYFPQKKWSLRTDLHVHTTASDGAYAPSLIMQLAHKKSIRVIAITDHDTVSGLKEAADAALASDISFIPGIELSSIEEDQEVHILGYHINPLDSELLETLQTLSTARENRALKIIKKLNNSGYPITMEEVVSKAGSEIIGRPHIALVMIDHGIIKNIDEGFVRFLGHGGSAYVPRYRISPAQAIQAIRKAGGLAVLAHPGQGDNSRLLPKLIDLGLSGIEVYHPDNSYALQDYLYRKAIEANLLITGGSDFHGHEAVDFRQFGRLPTPQDSLIRLNEIALIHTKPAD